MNDKACPYEECVAQTTRTGRWSEDLRAHVSQCKDCAEVEKIARWMRSIAESWRSAEPTSDPSLIWLKTQLGERQHLEARALRFAIGARAFVQLGLLVTLVFPIFYLWPAVSMYIARFLAWMPNAFIHPSIPSIGEPIAYVTSPVLILPCLAMGCLLLFPRLLRLFRWES